MLANRLLRVARANSNPQRCNCSPILRTAPLAFLPAALFLFSASQVFLAAVSVLLPATLVAQTVPRSHSLGSLREPPGALGFQRRIAGGPVGDSYYQAIRFKLPRRALVFGYSGPQAEVATAQVAPVFGIHVGMPYRFCVTRVPMLEDLPLYPSVELIDRTYPPEGLEARFPIVIELTMADLRAASEGRFVERVVYVEDPELALPVSTGKRSGQTSFDVDADEDALAYARSLGRPVAIVRLGSKGPDPSGNNNSFAFGSPPVILLPSFDPTLNGLDDAQIAKQGGRVAKPSGVVAATCNSGCIDDFDSCQQVMINAPAAYRHTAPDEYLCDGGDGAYPTRAGLDEGRGLEPADTVAQFSTDNGRQHIVASNRVCVYAPRFATVRRQTGLGIRNTVSRVGGLQDPVSVKERTYDTPAAGVQLDLAVEGSVGTQMRHEFEERTGGQLVDEVDVLWASRSRLLPNESRSRQVVVAQQWEQQPSLESSSVAVREWEALEALEITIDGRSAQTVKDVGRPSDVTVYEPADGDAGLEIIKHASPGEAEPGEEIVFTIRFRNVGEKVISNVRIIDSLTTRLEYVDDSESSSRRAIFSTADNIAGSRKLLWEVRQELQPGDAGEIRFTCRVR